MYSYCIYYKVNIHFDIILLASSSKFYTYHIISCNLSCNHNLIFLYYLRNKIKIKEKKKKNQVKEKEKKIKIKYKSSSVL